MKRAKFYYKDKLAPKPNRPNHVGTCAIIIHKDKILLEYRTDSDYWALIGGGLEIDESAESGMAREIYEETGIKISENELELFNIYSDPSRIIEYPDGNIIRSITIAYTLNIAEKHTLLCSAESRELKYFSMDDINGLDIVATHKHIIDDYGKVY